MANVTLNIANWALGILDDMSEMFVLIDADFNVLFVNKKACEVFHLNPQTAVGKNIVNLLPITNELFQPVLKQYFERLNLSENVVEEQVIFKQSAHKEISIHLKIERCTIDDANKGFKIISKLTHDATKDAAGNKLSNIEPHHNQPFYKLAEKSPDIIYILDVEKRIVVYFNRSELFGYDSKMLETTEGWIDIVHPSDINNVQAHWNKFLKTQQESASIEYRIKKKNETYDWVVNRHSILEYTETNQPKLILLNITVITDRKVEEQTLKHSKTKLAEIIEHSKDMIWSIDSDYNLTVMNTYFRNYLKNNYKTIANIGDNLLDCLPKKLVETWLPLHRKAFSGQTFITELQTNHHKNEATFEIEFNPIRDKSNEVVGVCVFAKNITYRKNKEFEIIKTNVELDSFVYRASHDLRAPLRSMQGLINIIKNEDDRDKQLSYLSLVDKSINKLDSFIIDLTNFSRNSRLEIKNEPIDFQTIIDEALENLQYMEYASAVNVLTDIDDATELYSDATRLNIIFQNLLSNAIKYCNHRTEKSWIKITVRYVTGSCNIAIEDNGIGIKEQYMNQIFNMFFRATNDSYGSGLGLYITKQVVEKLNGIISISSTIGLGTTFNIKLPNTKKH